MLRSWIKPREHAIVGLVPWNILPSFTFTSAIFEFIISVPQALIMTEAQIGRSVIVRVGSIARVGSMLGNSWCHPNLK